MLHFRVKRFFGGCKLKFHQRKFSKILPQQVFISCVTIKISLDKQFIATVNFERFSVAAQMCSITLLMMNYFSSHKLFYKQKLIGVMTFRIINVDHTCVSKKNFANKLRNIRQPTSHKLCDFICTVSRTRECRQCSFWDCNVNLHFICLFWL